MISSRPGRIPEKKKKENLHITKSNHADGLPDTKTNTRCDATVKTLDTVGLVDVLEGVANSHLLGSVGVVLLALHLHTDDLDRLVPCAQATTEGGCENLLPGAKLLTVLLAGDIADTLLRQTGETEARAPVGHLPDCDGVDTLVDATDTFAAVDVHESGPRALGGLPGGRHLVFGDLDRLHASAETHGGVCLSNTTRHATGDATSELRRAVRAGVVFGFRRYEEQNGSLGRGLNPGPGDESLVNLKTHGRAS